MEDWQRDVIQRNLPRLVATTVCSPSLLGRLRAEGILSDEDAEYLTAVPSSYDKSCKLYEVLVTRTNSYTILRQILADERQLAAFNVLSPKNVREPGANGVENEGFREFLAAVLENPRATQIEPKTLVAASDSESGISEPHFWTEDDAWNDVKRFVQRLPSLPIFASQFKTLVHSCALFYISSGGQLQSGTTEFIKEIFKTDERKLLTYFWKAIEARKQLQFPRSMIDEDLKIVSNKPKRYDGVVPEGKSPIVIFGQMASPALTSSSTLQVQGASSSVLTKDHGATIQSSETLPRIEARKIEKQLSSKECECDATEYVAVKSDPTTDNNGTLEQTKIANGASQQTIIIKVEGDATTTSDFVVNRVSTPVPVIENVKQETNDNTQNCTETTEAVGKCLQNVPSSLIESAYLSIADVGQAGRKLFDYCFTDDEVLEWSIRDTKSATHSFKISFIKTMLAYLSEKPNVNARTMQGYSERMSRKPEPELCERDFNSLKQKVFISYANRRRKRIRERTGQQSTSSKDV